MGPMQNFNAHQYLTFHEANILVENLRTQDKAGFLVRLNSLTHHTTDPTLLRELENLTGKIVELSESEFTELRDDVVNGLVLFPPNYELPKLTE